MAPTTTRKLAAAAIALTTLSMGASADVLAPGSSVSLGGTTVIASPWLQGVSPGGTTRSFSITGSGGEVVFSGTLLVSYRDTDPFGYRHGVYRVQNTTAFGPRWIVRIEFDGFGDGDLDVEYRTDAAAGVIPHTAARSADGDTVSFFFSGNLGAGATSQFFYIFTGAPELDFTGTARITLNTGEVAMVTGLPVPASCNGDTNGDGVVNFVDLNDVLTNYAEDCN